MLIDQIEIDFKYGNQEFRTNFVDIRKELLTDKLSADLRLAYPDEQHYVRLFISDIRSTFKDETEIAAEQDAQMRWHSMLDAHKSFLKFRLPYAPSIKKREAGKAYTKECLQYPPHSNVCAAKWS